MEKIYRWGFVAAGRMARSQARDMAYSPRNRIAGVVSRTKQSADAFASEFNATVYPSLNALLADPGIDVIYISSFNNLHHSQVKAALLAGKPVLCEKPFTLNARQLAELIEIATQKQTFLMEAMWVRYLPAAVKLRELLAGNAIGEIRNVEASFRINLAFDPSSRIFNPALGGGSLLDVGIYPISFSSMVFGMEPNEIVSKVKIASTGVDSNFEAEFNYGDGRHSKVSAGADGAYPNEAVIRGTDGEIKMHGTWRMQGFTISAQGGSESFELPPVGHGYSYQADEVAVCLDRGALESPVMPLNESLAIMQTLDTLREQWGLVYPGEK